MNSYSKAEPETSDCSSDQLAAEVARLRHIIDGHGRQLLILTRAIIGPMPDRTKPTIYIDKEKVTALCRRLNQAAEQQSVLFEDEEVIER